MPGKFDAPVAAAGQNFSVGERQLLCMARALLRRAKVVVMDEATASVDPDTDSLIQETIRGMSLDGGYGLSPTVICIAHRLETVIFYDKVLVLDSGQVAEYGSPAELLAAEGSFYDLWWVVYARAQP